MSLRPTGVEVSWHEIANRGRTAWKSASSRSGVAPPWSREAAVSVLTPWWWSATGVDASRINAVVLVGGGHSAHEDLTLDRALAALSAQSSQAAGVRVFTVAYGEHPDLTVLGLLAMAGRGGFYDASTPSNIGRALAAALSNF